MQNFITLALYTADEDLLTYALEEAMSAVKFADIVRRDGIHRDGSFLQHTGMLCALPPTSSRSYFTSAVLMTPRLSASVGRLGQLRQRRPARVHRARDPDDRHALRR